MSKNYVYEKWEYNNTQKTQYLGPQIKQIKNNVLVYYEILPYMFKQNQKQWK